jgi:hypothetical protein
MYITPDGIQTQSLPAIRYVQRIIPGRNKYKIMVLTIKFLFSNLTMSGDFAENFKHQLRYAKLRKL